MLLVVCFAVAIVLATGFLSMLEAVIISVDDLKLARILYKRPAHENDIKYIIHHKRHHLSSIVLLSTLISIAGSSLVGALAAQQMDSTGLAIFTGLLTYSMLVFAKVLPKLFAVEVADKILGSLSPAIRICAKLLKPLLWCVMVWTYMLRLKRTEKVTRADLRSIIDYYSENGVIGQEEGSIARHALKIHKQRLSDLLPDKGPMIWLSSDSTVESVYEKVKESNYKRYIVISKGQATGIVLYRHLVRAVINGEQSKTIGELAKQAIFLAPETKLLDALQVFRSARVSVAILPGDTPEESKFITVKQVYRAILQRPV